MPSNERRCVAQALSHVFNQAVTPEQADSFLQHLQRLGFELTPIKGQDEEDN